VLERVLPEEIRSRGVTGSDEICREVAAALFASFPDEEAAAESPEAIFRRLAGG